MISQSPSSVLEKALEVEPRSLAILDHILSGGRKFAHRKRNVVKGGRKRSASVACDLCGMQRGNIMEKRERQICL